MEIEKRGQDYTIRLGEKETPRNVLRAIAIASFELSRPAGLGILHFDGGSTFVSEDADKFITEVRGQLRLDMDYVEGRQVKTNVDMQTDGTLRFNGWLYERDRGNPTPMLKRSQELLNHVDTAAALPTEVTSTKGQFKGESLDSRLEEWGYKRNVGETDEQFKSRVFPVLYKRDRILAGEFLFGKHLAEWEDVEKTFYVDLLKSNPSLEDLINFAKDVENFF